MTALPRGEGVSAWRQIADSLRAEIAAGIIRAAAQLPTEAALAERFGVNRHTVRRALSVLAREGLVRTTQGRGTFVEAAPLPYPIGARTRFSEIVARGGRDPGGTLLSAEDVPADTGVSDALRLAPGSPVLSFVTLRSADGAPISFARSHVPLPRFAGLAAMLRDGCTVSEGFARHGAGDYRRAGTRVSARLATQAEAARLELAAGRVVLCVDSVNVDRDGAPIQATHSIFAADRVEILVEG